MVFEKRKCIACSTALSEKWLYCPGCGESVSPDRKAQDLNFSQSGGEIDIVLKKISKDLANMMKQGNFPNPGFLNEGVFPGVQGIAISIVPGANLQPQVSIKTIKNGKVCDRNSGRREICKATTVGEEKNQSEAIDGNMKVEEPDMSFKTVDESRIFEISLPNVNEKDIKIERLPDSMEIRASSGKVKYFKILPISADSNVNVTFENEVLRLGVNGVTEDNGV
jgi:HSP20 family molecular chaperone IbpA